LSISRNKKFKNSLNYRSKLKKTKLAPSQIFIMPATFDSK
jgi:hypothetical protein